MTDMTEMQTIGARLDGLDALIRKLVKAPFPVPSSEQVDKLALALAKAQGNFINPPRNREVEVQPKKRDDGSWPKPYKFRYATADAITDAVRKPLAENGLSVTQPPIRTNEGLAIRTILMHESGQWMACELPALMKPNGNAQDQGSAITYARRYSLCAMLGIVADEDDDGNAADGHEVRDTREAPPRPVKPAKMVNAKDGMRLKMSKTDLQKLGNELLAAVRAADSTLILESLMVSRAPDFDLIKELSPTGYEALMLNVEKRREHLSTNGQEEETAPVATHDDNPPFDASEFMTGFLSHLARCKTAEEISELRAFNEEEIGQLPEASQGELAGVIRDALEAFDKPKAPDVSLTTKDRTSVGQAGPAGARDAHPATVKQTVTFNGQTVYDTAAGAKGMARHIIEAINGTASADALDAALQAHAEALGWIKAKAPGDFLAANAYAEAHRKGLKA